MTAVGERTMVRACHVEDVPPGEGRALTVEGRRVAVFRAAGGWYALDHACPHAGGPLADGILADCRVICPLHDRAFDLATGEALGGGEGVAAYFVEVRGDDVFVSVDERRSAQVGHEPRAIGRGFRG